MLDMIKTLEPGSGLTRECHLLAPEWPNRPLWSVVAEVDGLETCGGSDQDHPLRLVGTCGVSAADAMARGAAAAVQRFALADRDDHAPRRHLATAAALGGGALDFVAASLGDPAALSVPLTWYEGWWLDSAQPVLVPSPLVDYPAGDETAMRWFDPTPTGAAASGDLDRALREALLEIIERDAFTMAWATRFPLVPVDLDALFAEAPPSAHLRQFRKLLDLVGHAGLKPTLVPLPTAVPGVHCVTAGVVDRRDGRALAAVAVKASTHPVRALLIALQEAMRVRTVLIGVSDHACGRAPSALVRDDVDRATVWQTEPAVAEWQRWVGRLPRAPWSPQWTAVPLGVADLVRGVAADGAKVAAVELTCRLPVALREMGWRAVKVVAPGYLHLRMAERHAFGWVGDRIAKAAWARGGFSGGEVRPFPHPLI